MNAYYEQIKNSSDTYIRPELAARAINIAPQGLRVQARTAPDLLGFPVSVVGNRVLIPRKPFIAFFEGTEDEEGDEK
ncbi:MAG: hypothetical protein IKJ88_00780 [Clostridia bacterium]|nr:hypothetical protein [Clostridia bacterium]